MLVRPGFVNLIPIAAGLCLLVGGRIRVLVVLPR